MNQLRINGTVVDATEFAYEGCHKIYLIATPEDREMMLGCGYTDEGDIRPISELPEVWEKTCFLRLISSADLKTQYVEQGNEATVTYGGVEPQTYKALPLGPPVEGEPGGYDVGYDDLEDMAEPPKNSDDSQTGNDRRAWRGAQTLLSYVDLSGKDEFESSLADLVCDLRHFSDAVGIDWDAVIYRVDRWYDDEIHGVL